MSFNNLDTLYRQVIMDHYKNPRNRGKLDGDHITVELNTASTTFPFVAPGDISYVSQKQYVPAPKFNAWLPFIIKDPIGLFTLPNKVAVENTLVTPV